MQNITKILGSTLLLSAACLSAQVPNAKHLKTKCITNPLQSKVQISLAQKPQLVGMWEGQEAARIATAAQESNYEILFDEDFSLMTAGSPEEPDAEFITTNTEEYPNYYFFIPDEYTHTPGWTGTYVAQAGGSAGLCYPGYGGHINTPTRNMDGEIIVTFRAKSIGEKASFFAVLNCGDVFNPIMADMDYLTCNVNSTEWKDFSFIFHNLTGDDKAFFQINAATYSEKGIVVDDIKVMRNNDFVAVPTNLYATDFTLEGFTAVWDKAIGADSYLISLTETQQSEGDSESYSLSVDDQIECDADGNISTAPTGWDIHLTGSDILSADGGEDGTMALVLSSGSDYIVSPSNGSIIEECSVFIKTLERNGYAEIILDGWDGSEWWSCAYASAGADTDAGIIIDPKDFEEAYPGYFAFTGQFTKLRISIYGNAKVAIDNFNVKMAAGATTEEIFTDLEVEDTRYTFTGLNPWNSYAFSVKAVKGDVVTAASEVCKAKGLAAPVNLAYSDVDSRGGYTASWDIVPHATSYKVNSFAFVTMAQDVDGYEVFSENFPAAHANEGDAVSISSDTGISLNEYTSNSGWYGQRVLIGEGMIGCQSRSWTSMATGLLQTPILSLGNAETYTVSFDVQGSADDIIKIQNKAGIVAQAVIPGANSIYHVEGEMTGGSDFDQLLFYSYNQKAFLIGNVKIQQHVKAGDKLFRCIEEVVTEECNVRLSVERNEGEEYAFFVTASYQEGGATYQSNPSELKFVEFEPAVELNQMSAESAEAVYYDLSGKRMQSAPKSGFYLQKSQGKVHKTMKF